MRSRSTRWATLALGAAAAGWLLSPDLALAQGTTPEEELGPEAGTKRPAGPDERAGNLVIQGKLGYVAPFGSLATNLPSSRVVAGGPAFGASLGIGLSRMTVLELSGAYALLAGSDGSDGSERSDRFDSCVGCSGRTFDVGLGLVYHLVQELAFDPWISYGAGYRMATFNGVSQIGSAIRPLPDAPFHGVDVARIALGGDFYPVSSFGIGLFLGLDAGTFVSRPKGFGQTTYGFFQVGVRLALDPLRRPAAPARAARQQRPGWAAPPAAAAPSLGPGAGI